MAAPQGFEPRYADPESAVLPLNEGAVCNLEEPDTRLFLILWSQASAVNSMARQPSPVQIHWPRIPVCIQDIFMFESSGIDENGKVRRSFRATGNRPKFAERLATAGCRLRPTLFDSWVEV